MITNVKGEFKEFDASIYTSGENFMTSEIDFWLNPASVDTGDLKRDEHLRSADFFDVAKYPVITFKSKTFTKVNDTNYKVTGDLTMHGVTKAIELDATIKSGINPMNKKDVAGFKITGKVKRSDFAIGASTSNAIVGDEVSIVANAEMVKN